MANSKIYSTSNVISFLYDLIDELVESRNESAEKGEEECYYSLEHLSQMFGMCVPHHLNKIVADTYTGMNIKSFYESSLDDVYNYVKDVGNFTRQMLSVDDKIQTEGIMKHAWVNADKNSGIHHDTMQAAFDDPITKTLFLISVRDETMAHFKTASKRITEHGDTRFCRKMNDIFMDGYNEESKRLNRMNGAGLKRDTDLSKPETKSPRYVPHSQRPLSCPASNNAATVSAPAL